MAQESALANPTPIRPANPRPQGSERESREIWLASLELDTIHKVDVLTDFNILNRQGLIKQYKFDIEKKSTYQFPYSMAKPTTFGVMLYVVAHN